MARDRRTPAGRGSVYPDGDGWRAQLRIDGRRYRSRAATQGEAYVLLDELRRRAGAGVQPQEETVERFLEDWLRDVAPDRCQPNTLVGYQSKVDRYIIPAIGGVRLSKLTPLHVQRMLNELSKRGLSPRTVRQTRAILRRALSVAERWGYVTRNVATLVEPPHVSSSERQTLDAAEAGRLLDAVVGHRFDSVYVLAIALGLRQGEALGLRWRDIDPDDRILHVRKALKRIDKEYVLDEPKTTRSRRDLPLPEFVVRALRRRRVAQNEDRLRAGPLWADSELVHTTARGYPVNGTAVTHELYDILEAAGLPRISFHDLRHAATSLLHARGVPDAVRMALLGHSNISTTVDVYTHVPEDLKRDAAATLDEWFVESELGRGRG